jgi:two-component system, OmpR family, response regulator
MATLNKKIFIVDDDPIQAEMLREHLAKMSGFTIFVYHTGEECLKNVNEFPGIVFLDFYLNSISKNAMDGMDVLQEIKKVSPETDVVMLSGQDKIEVAVNTMKYGAFDYIVKGESAFYRAEKAVFNIYRFKKLQGNATKYRNLTFLLAGGIALLIILVMYLQLTGKISDMPGWS